MLNETFVNLCCSILLGENRFEGNVYSAITDIFSTVQIDSIPLTFRPKFQLVQTALKLRENKLTNEQIIDNIIAAGHFKSLDEFIREIGERIKTAEQIAAASQRVLDIRQFISTQKDIENFSKFISSYDNGEFSDGSEITDKWNDLVSGAHTTILHQQRQKTTEAIEELDLFNDDFHNILKAIEANYGGKNSISTGYSELDQDMNGGFEPQRLYIFGGSSGDGKSTLLLNFVRNAVERNKDRTGLPIIIPYYTMENLVDETLVRLYCCITKKTIKEIIQNFGEERTLIEPFMKSWQEKYNARLVIRYFAPGTVSASDLFACNEEIRHEWHGRGILKATYVDYLDLLRSGKIFDLHRLELGQITMDMKRSAALQRIPWITVTQLNRDAYMTNDMPTLANMSESMKKVDNADFVALIKSTTNAPDEDADMKYIHSSQAKSEMKIIIYKNRSGAKNGFTTLNTNFAQFRVDDRERGVGLRMDIPTTPQMEISSGSWI